MATNIATSIDVPDSVAAGAGVDISEASKVAVYLHGTFVGTVQWQISTDNVNWADTGAAQTAPGVIDVTTPANWIRADVTAYTSGTLDGRLMKVVE